MQEIRPGEVAVDLPDRFEASLYFIGRIRTPYPRREDCPRQASIDGPECQIEVFAPWVAALEGMESLSHLDVLYWLDQSRRDLVRQSPRHTGAASGTFALRSPVRPNPIGLARVRLVRVEGPVLTVRSLDCIDGTPLVDIKPERCPNADGA
ncbi:MAG: tRNA (N6-threonylcarbamoyladenosine(37)-N6)-methyltransferase TrmO [Pseudomonadota bacterium]